MRVGTCTQPVHSSAPQHVCTYICMYSTYNYIHIQNLLSKYLKGKTKSVLLIYQGKFTYRVYGRERMRSTYY